MANATLPICGYEFLPVNPTNISSDVYVAFASRTGLNIFTCPLTILLNILVIVAVKTKRQLRTKSNVALACLSTTDLVVGLVQFLEVVNFGLILKGGETRNLLCIVVNVTATVSSTCISASLFHLLLMSGDRYLAIKHSFAYETGLVTETRIVMASVLAWMCAVIVFGIGRTSILRGITVLLTFIIISIVITFHVVIYKEVRRNTQQIIANQVSLEAKEKLLKNKKAFKTTVLVLVTILLCYIPTYAWVIVFPSLEEKISSNVGHIVFTLSTSLLVLNSLLNPLIYTVRITIFRVAFIQMLSRKTLQQAEDLEQRIFGSNQIEVAKSPQTDAPAEDNKRTE